MKLHITSTFFEYCTLHSIAYMTESRDEANKGRLLNVLYANLSICQQIMGVLMFERYMELQLLGVQDTALSCVTERVRIFHALFILLLVLQISVVTSINHYNPGLYLALSLHWRRIPIICFQLVLVTLFLGVIEFTEGFKDICISDETKTRFNWNLLVLLTLNLLLQLGVVVDSFWGWGNIRTWIRIKKKNNSIRPQHALELGQACFNSSLQPSAAIVKDKVDTPLICHGHGHYCSTKSQGKIYLIIQQNSISNTVLSNKCNNIISSK